MYPYLGSAIRPIPHDSSLIVPALPVDGLVNVNNKNVDECTADIEYQDVSDADLTPDDDDKEPNHKYIYPVIGVCLFIQLRET